MLNKRSLWMLLAACCLWLQVSVRAADETAGTKSEQEVRAAGQRYIEAVQQGDLKTMAEMWAPGGDIVDEFGRALPAREFLKREAAVRQAAIEANGGEEPPRKPTHVIDSSLRFVTPDVAIEDGHVDVSRGDGLPPLEGRFTAVWVNGDGRWRLASLREIRLPTTSAGELASLDWMVGHWTGQGGKATFDMTTHWNQKHTYLLRDLTVTHDGKVILSGQQRIGIDPLDGQIKSWMYDADGGHGEGTWTRHGDSWVVQAAGVSPDGRQTTSTNVYQYDGGDSFSWKSLGGTSNGQPMPPFEITLHREDSSK